MWFSLVTEGWCDTTSKFGRLMMTIMGGINEFERELIRERCEDGIERAKQKGTKFGRPTVLDLGQRRRSRSATLPARQWQSWRVSTSAVRPRFGGRCNSPFPALGVGAALVSQYQSARLARTSQRLAESCCGQFS